MYLGKLVEEAPVDALYEHPLHPYTQALLSAIPVPDPRIERARERIVLHRRRAESGLAAVRMPLPHALLEGDRSVREPRSPQLVDHGDGHRVACHYPAGAPTP